MRYPHPGRKTYPFRFKLLTRHHPTPYTLPPTEDTMTKSKGIRRSTKWKAIATQQSARTLDALEQGDRLARELQTWKTTATFNQRLSAAFGVVVLAEAVVLAALWMAL